MDTPNLTTPAGIAAYLRDQTAHVSECNPVAVLERIAAAIESANPAPRTGTVADKPDAELVEYTIRNAGRLLPRAPRWHHVAEAIGLGSTYAAQLCRRFGLDPEEEVGMEQEAEEEEEPTPATVEAGVCNGWERATEEIVITGGGDETAIDSGDWLWRDAAGRVRRAYGWLGGSHRRAHTYDAEGNWIVGVEVRDERTVPESDLNDPDRIHPIWRSVVETYPIERAS
jgi:hypothetical protein